MALTSPFSAYEIQSQAGFESSGSSEFTGSIILTGSMFISGNLFMSANVIQGTSSFAQTASWAIQALTASYLNTLNQNVLITGSLTVGASSLGANENTLVLGPSPAGGTGEGGQILLQAPGGTYTSASMWDNYQNQTRLLRGTNAGSDAIVASFNMHTKQVQFPTYTNVNSFPGTAAAFLAVDTSGNIITTSSAGGGGSTTINNNVDNYIITGTGTLNTLNGESNLQFNGSSLTVTGQITASGAIVSQANGAMYFRGGDDAEFWDINVANTVGIYGQQNADRAGIKLGSSGPTLFGSASRVGIGTITPTLGTLEVNGNVYANSFTGSLFGTSSWAQSSSQALTASVVTITSTGNNNNYSVLFATSSISPSPLNFNSGRLYFNPNEGVLSTTTYANTNAGTVNPITASWASSASIAISSSFATTASFVTSASFATSSSFATNALTASVVATIVETTANTNYPIVFVTSSVNSSGSILNVHDSKLRFNPNTAILSAGEFANTNTGIINQITSSWAVSSSRATSASFAISASFVTSASFAASASFTSTSSLATNANNILTVSDSTTNAPFYVTFVDSDNTPGDYEKLYTQNGLSYNPSTKLLTTNVVGNLIGTASWATNALTSSFLSVGSYNITASQALTASFTPNALVTASVSSNVLTFTKGNGTTFNLTVNTGSGVGGADTHIQFNSQSAFGGSNKLTYDYDINSQFSNRLKHKYSEDFRTSPFTTDFRGSYLPQNEVNSNKIYAGISHFHYSLPANTGATAIYAFDAQGGTPGNLSMQGFKCDYSLLLYDGVNKVASRVGTLLGAWSYDTGITPVIQDTFVDGDQVFNELGTVVFTLVWNGPDINLEMDCGGVNNGTTHFSGLFTNFGNTL